VLGKEMSYKEGMKWVYKYYRGESVESGWKSGKVGMLREVLREVLLKEEKEEMDVEKQKAYVLPKDVEYKIEWRFCKYLWEGEIVFTKEM
jgi:hypothetical protein